MSFYTIETAKLQDLARQHRDSYVTGKPFPHIYLDGVFPEEVLNTVLEEFPNSKQIDWQRYQNNNEVKLASRNELEFGSFTRKRCDRLYAGPDATKGTYQDHVE